MCIFGSGKAKTEPKQLPAPAVTPEVPVARTDAPAAPVTPAYAAPSRKTSAATGLNIPTV